MVIIIPCSTFFGDYLAIFDSFFVEVLEKLDFFLDYNMIPNVMKINQKWSIQM